MPFRLPRWLRLSAFLLILCVAIGLSVYGIRQAIKPVTLKLAVGSLDIEATRVLSAIGSRMAATGSPVRIAVVEKPTATEAAEAFAAGEVDLAVVRADAEELGSARAVVQVTNLAVMIMVPPNSPIKTVADLKGKTVGVVGLEVNRRVLAALVQSYGFAQGSVQFVDIPFLQVLDPNRPKKHQAAIFVAPLADKYNAIVRNFFPVAGKAQPSIIEIDSAEAIALTHKFLELFDMPKGTLRGAPPIPDDSLSTLRIPVYLVANQKVGDDTVAALAKSIMQVRRELQSETPLVAQIAAPDDDKSAPLPIHPGAKAFFSGEEKTWSDKYGDWLFYGPIILGMVGSFMAGLWKFLTGDEGQRKSDFAQRLASLVERIRKASSEDELEAIDSETDQLLNDYLAAQSKGQIDADQAAALNLIVSHLESAIDRRSRALKDRLAAGMT